MPANGSELSCADVQGVCRSSLARVVMFYVLVISLSRGEIADSYFRQQRLVSQPQMKAFREDFDQLLVLFTFDD